MSLLIATFGFAAVFLAGCRGEPRLSGSEQVKAFELAGPITPKVDLDQLLTAKNNYDTYTVGTGDVLELQMPTILTAVSPKLYKDLRYQQQQVQPYLCRVSDSGTIALPMLGQINVVGKTLAQIETEIVNAYYPKYIVSLPSVVCTVKEYYLKSVTVVGAVVQPGVYKLQSNEMSLVNALMKAGGIVEGGASVITIKNPKRKYTTAPRIINEVKQLAEFGDAVDKKYTKNTKAAQGKADFSALQVDLAFRPENNKPAQGTLIVQRGSEILHSEKIDMKNAVQRTAYTKELEKVIGAKQAYIVGQAIEQLAGQFSPAIAASQEKQLNSEETELLEAANDLEHSKAESRDAEKKKSCPGSPAPASSTEASNQKYIETPVEDKVEFKPIDSVNDVQFIEPAKSKERAAAITPPTYVADAIVLPVKGLNIPFADVPLMEGDLIEVKRLDPAVFTVIGLAKAPGVFPYPPEVEYNLMQAIGFAGGVDLIADPRFVTVYRQDAKGEIVSAVFRIDRDFIVKSCNVRIKPGDVISIDVTPRTKRNVILNQMLRINFGIFINPLSLND